MRGKRTSKGIKHMEKITQLAKAAAHGGWEAAGELSPPGSKKNGAVVSPLPVPSPRSTRTGYNGERREETPRHACAWRP